MTPQVHHSKLSDIKLSQSAQNALAAKDLIVNERVMNAVYKTSKQLSKGILQLLALKMDEGKIAIDLDYLALRINDLNNENRLGLERMRALQDAGILTSNIANQIDDQFQRNQTELHDLFVDQDNKTEDRNALLKKLHLASIKELCELTIVSATSVIEIRRDLEIKTDSDAILNQYKESIAYLNDELPGFIEETWAKMKMD